MKLQPSAHWASTASWLRIALAIAALTPTLACARGPSAYLPLDLDPHMERQIERVLILAGKPVMRRPIAAAIVLDALPNACEQDAALCIQVRRYLDRYMRTYGVMHARAQAAITSGDSMATLPNRHGEPVDSVWRASVNGYYQPNDYLILSVGGIGYDGNATATGSVLSTGFDFAQLDIGFRDHWLGPMSDSSMTISSEAPTMPSVTLSNYKPLGALGLGYELFAAELSHRSDIVFGATTTEGRPRLAGLQLVLEPVTGYAVSFNRITQYGGGARGGRRFSDFVDAITTTTNQGDSVEQADSDVNRIAAVASNILFPGPVPFGVRVEYGGEDNTWDQYRLGQTNLSFGIDFPSLWRNFDATYEISEFQSGWYVHHIYPDGPRNEGNVLGHWLGDNRERRDAIGGRSHLLRVGWTLPRGDYARATYRALDLDPRWAFTRPHGQYQTMQMFGVEYTTHWKGHAVNAQLEVGEDVFGASFARLAAAFDFAPSGNASRSTLGSPAHTRGTELFVDTGVQYSRAREYLLLQFQQRDTTPYELGYHVGVGARRAVSSRSDLGVRIELDEVADRTLVSVRAVDYRFRLNPKIALGAFFGVGRYDLTLDAHGWYFGVGGQYRNIIPGWDLGLDYRRYDRLNRDKGLPSDPESNPGLPRRYIDVDGISLSMSKRW